jgi:2-(1,2-epoxy-1,2-dihydrophenyl)acetyl-CoA isomerase
VTRYDDIALQRDGGVATIVLQRPDALNAFTHPMARELLDALGELARDETVRAVVLTGAGRAFSAGADLKGPSDERPVVASGRPDLGWALRELYNPLILALREMPQPVIAAVNGVAAGVGCSIALACDLVVAARSASFMLAFVNVALVPDGGASLLVAARAGVARASEMALLGARVDAEEALRWNLVNQVEEDAVSAAAAVAARLAAGPPEALAAIKALVNEPWLQALRAQLGREAVAQTGRSDCAEVDEAIAAFREKRHPVFARA